MKRSIRHIATLLTVIITVITISPLATFSMRSAIVIHAMTGECTGNCDTCDCSPERRAAHTCCCWHKKKAQQKNRDLQNNGCCRKTKNSRTPVITAIPPCESGKLLALWGEEELRFLPYHFAGEIPAPGEDILTFDVPDRMPSRRDKPPVPPPKPSTLS